MTNPFAHLADEEAHDAEDLRRELLADTHRGFAKMRKVGIQRPKAEKHRPSMLPFFVRGSSERALDAWLLLLALEPVLGPDDPLPMATWARLLGIARPCSETSASRAFAMLVSLKLADRRLEHRRSVLAPLLEDGSGHPYFRPGSAPESGPGYFTIPHEYWTDGYADRLRLPGKVALLIALAETSLTPTFEVPTTRADEWYGISERTLERGYQELSDEKLLLVHGQRVKAKRSKVGFTTIYHRALIGPFSTEARQLLQESAADAVNRKAATVGNA